MFDEYPDVLNTAEVMQILDITKNTLYELIHSGALPAYRIGKKKWRVNKDSLIKVTPHNYSAYIAQSDFSSDVLKFKSILAYG